MEQFTFEKTSTLALLQEAVADILSSQDALSAAGCAVYPENLLDIDFEIKKALGQQGIVGVVTAMDCTYIGHNNQHPAWQVDNLEVDFIENVQVHRPWLKKQGLSYGTAQECATLALDALGGPHAVPGFGVFCPVGSEIRAQNSLVVAKAKLKCAVAMKEVSYWEVRRSEAASIVGATLNEVAHSDDGQGNDSTTWRWEGPESSIEIKQWHLASEPSRFHMSGVLKQDGQEDIVQEFTSARGLEEGPFFWPELKSTALYFHGVELDAGGAALHAKTAVKPMTIDEQSSCET